MWKEGAIGRTKDVDGFEDTSVRIICGQSFAEDRTDEEMTMQLEFVSAIRCHDPCTMELLHHVVAKIRSIWVV